MFARLAVSLLVVASPALALEPALDPLSSGSGRATIPFDVANTTKADFGYRLLRLNAFPPQPLLAVGTVDIDDPNTSLLGLGIARIANDGSLDTTFQDNGKRVKNPLMRQIRDAQLVPETTGQRLVVVGESSTLRTAVQRFTTAGDDDTGFSTDGETAIDFSGTGNENIGVAIAADPAHALYWVGGQMSQPLPGDLGNVDIFVAKLDMAGNSQGVAFISNLGSSTDRFYDLQPVGSESAPTAMLALSSAGSDNVAGYIQLVSTSNAQLLWSESLAKPSLAESGCRTDTPESYPGAIVADWDDPSRYFVIGMFLGSGMSQTYVIELNTTTHTIVDYYCAPAVARYDYVTHGLVERVGASPAGEKYMHVGINGSGLGYQRWRWVVTPGFVYRMRPDTTFAKAGTLLVSFPAITGGPQASAGGWIATEALGGRPLVLGTRLWNQTPPLNDWDFALFKLRGVDLLFGANFD